MKLFRKIPVLLVFLAVLSCLDDWEFSADNRYTLSFSADTVMMDTVFAGVASASESFMIYNPNDVGIRLDAVLSGGQGSPFRINLDGQGGTQITDLEIAAGDSLYCFVSVNMPETDAAGVFHVTDSVRFVLESGNVQYVRLSAYGENAVRLRGWRVESDTVLTARLPYIVFDSLYVADGATLTLAPGTRLYFHSGAVLDVAGRVVADGNADSVILMRGDRLDVMSTEPPVPYDLVSDQWRGIRIRGGSYNNVFKYCDIHSGEFGISADSASAQQIKFTLHSSIINNMSRNCIEATGCRIDVANSQITNAGVSCVDIAGGEADFTFCTIAGFSLWSVGSQAVLISDNRNDADVPFVGVRFRNCIITGRHADEFVTELSDSIENLDNYYVGHSLVMTSDTLDTHFHDVVFDSFDSETGGAGNFIGRSRDGLRPVFRLDSLSCARGIADTLAVDWPLDIRGVARPAVGADAGCYQYTSE